MGTLQVEGKTLSFDENNPEALREMLHEHTAMKDEDIEKIVSSVTNK